MSHMPMLIMHAGMPKTGTTSIQKCLAASATALAAIGVDYPADFRNCENIAQHKLSEELASSDGLEIGPIALRFTKYIEDVNFSRVIISTEAMSNCVLPQRLAILRKFLSIIAKKMPVRMTFVIRRMDNFVESMYLHSIKTGELKLDICKYVEERKYWAGDFLTGLKELRNSGILESLQLVKYGRGAAFVHEFLTAMAMDRGQRQCLHRVDDSNRRLGLRAQAMLFHFDQITASAGVAIDQRMIAAALERGEVELADDCTDYTVVSTKKRRELHENALQVARRIGLTEYEKFFGDDTIPEMPAVELTPNLVRDADIRLLKSFSSRHG